MASILSNMGGVYRSVRTLIYEVGRWRLHECCQLCGIVFVALMVNLWSANEAYSDKLRLAITTSLEDSGLLQKLWQAYDGTEVQVIAVGSGAALELGRRGDVDLLVVHDRVGEEQFINDGYGVARLPWVRNDFVLIGPKNDNVNLAQAGGILPALQLLGLRGSQAKMIFVSRGDDSGTHKRELALQKMAGVDLKAALGSNYVVSGQGMGASLNIAMNKWGYILSDLGSWLNRSHYSQDMRVLVQGSPLLENPYSVLILSNSTTKKRAVHKLVLWLFSEKVRKITLSYKLRGVQVFTPQAVWPGTVEIGRFFRNE